MLQIVGLSLSYLTIRFHCLWVSPGLVLPTQEDLQHPVFSNLYASDCWIVKVSILPYHSVSLFVGLPRSGTAYPGRPATPCFFEFVCFRLLDCKSLYLTLPFGFIVCGSPQVKKQWNQTVKGKAKMP